MDQFSSSSSIYCAEVQPKMRTEFMNLKNLSVADEAQHANQEFRRKYTKVLDHLRILRTEYYFYVFFVSSYFLNDIILNWRGSKPKIESSSASTSILGPFSVHCHVFRHRKTVQNYSATAFDSSCMRIIMQTHFLAIIAQIW